MSRRASRLAITMLFGLTLAGCSVIFPTPTLPSCSADDIQVAAGEPEGVSGGQWLVFLVVANVGSATCVIGTDTHGELRDASGAVVESADGSSAFLGPTSPTIVLDYRAGPALKDGARSDQGIVNVLISNACPADAESQISINLRSIDRDFTLSGPSEGCVDQGTSATFSIYRLESEPAVSRASVYPRRMNGRVASVNVSKGGVPKLPIERAWVGSLGLDTDAHNGQMHGGPNQAVCLYSVEAIERVAADGHRAFAGSYGENLTIEGMDWAALREGDRFAIGDDGLAVELTYYAAPCTNLSHYFTEERIARISPRVHPEDSRWYARVLAEGPVATGDRVEVTRPAEGQRAS